VKQADIQNLPKHPFPLAHHPEQQYPQNLEDLVKFLESQGFANQVEDELR
jgi:hypothetical protein